jgi:hypothetical protein
MTLRRYSWGVGIVAIATSGLSLVPAPSGAAAAGGACSVPGSFSGTTITWTGQGGDSDWSNASNWNPQTVPDADQTPATYQDQYVCISGAASTVQIGADEVRHVAGVDVASGATLTIGLGASLYVGAATGSAVPSYVGAKSELHLLAGTLGGNSPLNVAGTLRWSGEMSKGHKKTALQTSSECVANPAQAACPGDLTPGGGRTVIAASGKLLVDGSGFGGVELGDQRVIDNSGTLELTHLGYISMDSGTKLIDERGSSLDLDSPGGIYAGATDGSLPTAKVVQKGSIVKDSDDPTFIGVPTSISGKTHITVTRGDLYIQSPKLPSAPVARAGVYGAASCVVAALQLCHVVNATADFPQTATVRLSSESSAPAHSTAAVALKAGPSKVGGHAVIGKAIAIKGPKEFHATQLAFGFDKTMSGVGSKAKATVYRGGTSAADRVPMCSVERVSQANPSCVLSVTVAHGGGQSTSGDLTVIVETEQPTSTWLVT